MSGNSGLGIQPGPELQPKQAPPQSKQAARPTPAPRNVGFRRKLLTIVKRFKVKYIMAILVAACAIMIPYFVLMFYNLLPCTLMLSSESCSEPPYPDECSTHYRWAQRKISGLRKALEDKVQGQPLAIDMICGLIRMHLKEGYIPRHALSFVFHGTTGIGKNFISHIITDHMSEKPDSSSYIHLWNGATLFEDSHQKTTYQETIREWVKGNITACPYQLFIFDEVDKMPNGTLDILSPFLDFNPPIQDAVDYRKAIYIFLSNVGGEVIHNKALEYHKAGKDRAVLKMSDFDNDLMRDAHHYKGGLKGTSILRKHLVGAFVPFLPLDKTHVRECVFTSLAETNEKINRGTEREKLVDEVMSELTFGEVFSISGCKHVYEKTNVVLERYWKPNNEETEVEPETPQL